MVAVSRLTDITPIAVTRVPARGKARAPWGLPLVLAFVATACIGFNTTRVAGFPLADVIFLASAGLVAAHLLMGQARNLATADMRRAPTPFVVGSLLILGAGTWSTLWVEAPGASIMVLLRIAWLTLVWSWLLRSVAVGPKALDRLILGYRIAVMVSAVAAAAGQLGLVAIGETYGGRQVAFTYHPNNLGGLLAIGLPFFVFDTRTTKPEGDRRQGRSLVLRLLASGLVVFALLATGSMSATFAAIAGTVSVFGAQRLVGGTRRRRNGPLVGIAVSSVVFVGLLGLVATGAPAVERFTGFLQGDVGVSGSVEGRGEQDGFVIDRVDRLLIMGIGFDQGTSEVHREAGEGIHNILLLLLYEAGLPAVAGLLTLWLLAARQGWRLLLNTRGTSLHMLVLALVGSLVTATVFAQFHPMVDERYYWFPLLMIGATWSLRRHQLRRPRALSAFVHTGRLNGHHHRASTNGSTVPRP